MTNLTDFSQTDDVSDAAIEWASQQTGRNLKAEEIRQWAAVNNAPDCARILAARLIQQYRPDLLVDPVDAKIIELMIGRGMRHEASTDTEVFAMCKRAYLMGKEAGK